MQSPAQRDLAQAASAGRGACSSAGAERAGAELRAALVMARRFPRDEAAAMARILRACARPQLAQEAVYALRRGGRLSLSPSLRLARVIALAWGNLQLGTRELARRRGQLQLEAFCWDLESNVREVRGFDASCAPREQVKALDETRGAAYESPAAAGARRERACILALIPQDVVEAALARCEKTLANYDAEIPLDRRIATVVQEFEQVYGVNRADLEELLDSPLDEAREPELVRLRAVLKALRDGFARRQDFFPARRESRSGAERTPRTTSRAIQGRSGAREGRGGRPEPDSKTAADAPAQATKPGAPDSAQDRCAPCAR